MVYPVDYSENIHEFAEGFNTICLTFFPENIIGEDVDVICLAIVLVHQYLHMPPCRLNGISVGPSFIVLKLYGMIYG